MQQIAWNINHIKRCEELVGQAMLRDEHTLALFSEDFGRLTKSQPSAVFTPQASHDVQKIIKYAQSNSLCVTIRGNGMSQCGQSLALPGGLIINLEKLNTVCEHNDSSIWVEANTTWAELLLSSLKKSMIPLVVPYNCNLTVAGVISAGGVGASSFKHGSVITHVEALEVVTANGELQRVDVSSPLFHACLGGQGRFGVITKACLRLRPCRKQVRTFFLVYLDKEHCFKDLTKFRESADYIEFFCSPSIQGAKLTEKGRAPFAQWLYALHIAVEYEDEPPDLKQLNPHLNPWKVVHTQDESIESYLHRHDSRFAAMKLTGQWEMQHMWYECFVPGEVLINSLDDILASLPLYYANVLQIAPIASKQSGGFFMLPDAEDVYAVMILNPGIPNALVPACMDTIHTLDERFLSQGGKRYLSGYIGQNLASNYWQNHFDAKHENWVDLKKEYDPAGIFRSVLHA